MEMPPSCDSRRGHGYNGAVGELIFHNRYSYANGNPVNLVDPNGMQACLPGIECAIPNDSPIDWCSLYPNAPGCASGQITLTPVAPIISVPPDFGDLPTEQLWNTCMLLNDSLCAAEIDRIGDILQFARGRSRQRGPKDVGRDRNGKCNACDPTTITCRQDIFPPQGRSRVGHGCNPSNHPTDPHVAQLHIETLSWYGPLEENGKCMCYPIRNEVVHCLKRWTDMIALRPLCPGGVRVNFG